MSTFTDLVGVELGADELARDHAGAGGRVRAGHRRPAVDPHRPGAGRGGAVRTIAHGFLTLSLCIPFLHELMPDRGFALTVNYGVNRVRFPAPVPVGSRIRSRFRIESVDEGTPASRR